MRHPVTRATAMSGKREAGADLAWARQAQGIVEEPAVVAAHVAEPVGDEAPCAVFELALFPVGFRAAMKTEQHFGDGAIAGTGAMGVECPQDQDMSVACLLWQRVMPRTGRTSVDRPPEAQHGLGSQFQERIQRQDNRIGDRMLGRRGVQPEAVLMAERPPMTVPSAVLVGHPDQDGEIGQAERYRKAVIHRRWRRTKLERVWLQCGCPEEHRAVGRQVWIGREIATPNGRQRQLLPPHLAVEVRWHADSRDGSPRLGADIPKRSRKRKCFGHGHRRPASANWNLAWRHLVYETPASGAGRRNVSNYRFNGELALPDMLIAQSDRPQKVRSQIVFEREPGTARRAADVFHQLRLADPQSRIGANSDQRLS
ncbi:hypothetical protein KL86PLE_10054 [uncultured Pleomorphomonas sp.]|uniref:Uncharacterized protein n=1 Tax=uncultured Pleomorphomonas sp. TaxID=442121 RepID=A0A212KXY3_9HYPH|nr:hypothetical protein KL86PLE_10054 [uncultured Pleomorphomonas sp.]